MKLSKKKKKTLIPVHGDIQLTKSPFMNGFRNLSQEIRI